MNSTEGHVLQRRQRQRKQKAVQTVERHRRERKKMAALLQVRVGG